MASLAFLVYLDMPQSVFSDTQQKDEGTCNSPLDEKFFVEYKISLSTSTENGLTHFGYFPLTVVGDPIHQVPSEFYLRLPW